MIPMAYATPYKTSKNEAIIRLVFVIHAYCFQFQKSVWIHPFECGKELRCVCEYLKITPYTMMFTAKIENDRILRRYFLREGVLLRHHLSLLDKGVRY